MIPYEIIHLPKEQWEGTIIPMRYTTEEYYNVKIEKEPDGYSVTLHKCKSEQPISHYPEEYNFPDKLYQPHWKNAYAWGIVEETENGKELLACIETCPEEWSNRLLVTELWVHEKLRRQGVAHKLMALAKEQAVLEHKRAIILETQSCNAGAISFYLKEGFELTGFDSCCYSNNDIERKEVRLNLGFFTRPEPKPEREHILLRREEKCDYHETEQMALKAFWNKYMLGCDEHLLVHKLRNSKDYLPELSRVAVVDHEIAGAIFYSRAWLKNGTKEKEILTFGPLCVAPKWQGCGIGSMLLEETLKLAKQAGYEGVVIFGEPDYYPLHGFLTCDNYGITTKDGKNFDSFLGIELVPNGLKGFGGIFCESSVFDDLSAEENETFTRKFHTSEKHPFPSQWK